MRKAIVDIQQVHLTLVEHNDLYSKNSLIVSGDRERVVWVDFDVAIVYSNDTYIEEKGRRRIEFETEVVESFEQLLVCSRIAFFSELTETDMLYRMKIRKKICNQTQNTTKNDFLVHTLTYTNRDQDQDHFMKAVSHYSSRLTSQDIKVSAE